MVSVTIFPPMTYKDGCGKHRDITIIFLIKAKIGEDMGANHK